MSKCPKVSVIISNYNGLKLNILKESLDSILQNDYPNLEVILIDNASTDKSVDMVKKRFGKNPKLSVIQNLVNMYSQGLNLGIKNSRGEYIAFFNNDVVVQNGYFQNFIKYLNKNKNVALAQGKLLSYFDHTIIDSAGETTDVFGSPITIGAHQRDGKKFNNIVEVLSVSGSCSILRRAVIDKIGLFDKDYGIGYEDLDLAIRARLKGYRIVYFPRVTAFHRRGVTDLSSEIKVKVRWHFNKNRIMTIIKNYPLETIVKNLPITILIYMTTGLWEILIKKKPKLGLTRFSSLIWIVLNLPSILRKRYQIQRSIKKNNFEPVEKLFYKNTLRQGFFSFLKVK